jgi:hypothetical protein
MARETCTFLTFVFAHTLRSGICNNGKHCQRAAVGVSNANAMLKCDAKIGVGNASHATMQSITLL